MSASVFALRQIFSDPVVSLRRRLDAAEAVLMFESPEVVAADAKAFLTEIFEDPDCHVNWRVAALKIMRRAESSPYHSAPVSVRARLIAIVKLGAGRRLKSASRN